MCCMVHMCAGLGEGGVYYTRSCTWRLARCVLKKWWFTFSLIHFGMKSIFSFGEEKKDTRYSKRESKNGRLMIIGYNACRCHP